MSMPASLVLCAAAACPVDLPDGCDLPPEHVCEAWYRAAQSGLTQARELYDVAGGWHLQCELERARLWRDFWWAAWWVTWRQATPAQREHWWGRCRELTGDDR